MVLKENLIEKLGKSGADSSPMEVIFTLTNIDNSHNYTYYGPGILPGPFYIYYLILSEQHYEVNCIISILDVW